MVVVQLRRLVLAAVLALAAGGASPLAGQDHGAVAVGELAHGIGVSSRVLLIGAHPDDEDTQLITWLARGRQVETAYLSLTRGDGGQNLIGNELGEALGAIRTEELLSARRLDGGRQYFTRAYDFGFSKSAAETYQHWPHDSLLDDVVTVIRAFRPHVIVSVFSGTARDGHGHHQVAGLLAREGYDAAGDSTRFPTARFGPAWSPAKFYRGARFSPATATLTFDVGEFSPLRGRSYAELAGESRSQHKSQAFGSLQRKGVVLDYLRLEHARVATPADPKSERSLFDGVDTSWARFRPRLTREGGRSLDSLVRAFADVRRSLDLLSPARILAPLGRVQDLIRRLQRGDNDADFSRSLSIAMARADRLTVAASGIGIEAFTEREVYATGDSVPVRVTVYNRGPVPVTFTSPIVIRRADDGPVPAIRPGESSMLAPGDSRQFAVDARTTERSAPWWLREPRDGDLFRPRVDAVSDDARAPAVSVAMSLTAGGATARVIVPVEYRFADPVRGEIVRPCASAPAVSITLAQVAAYLPANRPVERPVRVSLVSSAFEARDVVVSLALPPGLSADSVSRTVSLPPGGSRDVDFLVRGRVPVGAHTLRALATVGRTVYDSGYVLVSYDHIRPQRLYRAADMLLRAVDVAIPPRTTVAYVPGVGDNVAEPLRQLGLPVTVIDAADLATTDLSRFSTVVVGPRAYEASAALVTHGPALHAFVRNGGTIVAQYGQYEMTQPGLLPYPITLGRPADRVTVEEVPVRILAPESPVLRFPNRITERDFDGWVQERALYMPRAFASEWTPLLGMNDPGEPENRGAILVAPLGRGMYVYTTASFFRQLPAAVPGAARLIVNLIAAAQRGGVAQ